MKLTLTKIIENISEVIPDYPSYSRKDREWLIDYYSQKYKDGANVVQRDIFTNQGYETAQKLLDRVESHPQIAANDPRFIRKLSFKDEKALDAVLDETQDQNDFIYEVFEQNFVDKKPKPTSAEVPEEIKGSDLNLLAEESYSNGIIFALDVLAKNEIIKYARKEIGSGAN
jgi:hypothetical protein